MSAIRSAAEETAYYLNPNIPAVALICMGVRFPSGSWRWIASATALAWAIEEMLRDMFPALPEKIEFVVLTTDFEVAEFERSSQTS